MKNSNFDASHNRTLNNILNLTICRHQCRQHGLCNYIVHRSRSMVPIAVFTLALFRPCMPPILTSMLYLQYSWADSGQSGIMFKTATAILMSYFWFMIPGTVLTEVLLFLLYPAEVKLMILKEIKRLKILYVWKL